MRVRAGLVATLLSAVGMPLLAVPASAAAINDPPAAPHGIIVFPVRDFVSASGYSRGDRPTVHVVRGGVIVGTAADVVPSVDGLVEVNHPGGACWQGVTPDIRAGDVIQVLTSPGIGDQTPTADVTVTQPATKVDEATVIVQGTAATVGGAQIPITELESRLVANQQAFVKSTRRTLRADSTGTAEGLLAYDGRGPNTWTATFTGMDGISTVDGISDADRAVASETRGMWRGRNPAATAEGTIYEFGQVGGPAAPCTAPLAAGPSTPDLTPGTDTGASTTDNITGNPAPTFTGVTGLPSATSVTLYVDGAVNGTAAVGAGGSYSLTPATPLADGHHVVTASESAVGTETMSSASLSLTIDTVPAAAPTVSGTLPSSPGTSSSPAVTGIAEASSAVALYTGATCTTPAVGNGSAADFASTGISAVVAVDATTTVFATATDLAGNASPCSTSSISYTQDSIAPPVPDIGASSPAGLVNSTSGSFTFSDSEAGTGFRCSRDGAPATACTSPASYAGLGEGAHTFAVQAVDAAGNASSPATASWTVDTVAPTMQINSPVGSVLNDTSPTFRFTASEPGTATACAIDGAPVVTCSTLTSQTSSGLADGPHTFTVTGTDQARNTGPAASYSFDVDTSVPPVSLDSTPPNPSSNNVPSFAFSSSKPGVSFSCSFALAVATSPTLAPCTSPFSTGTPRADGDYRFTVKATDAAGNVGSGSGLLTIDTTSPAAATITSRPVAVSSVTTPSFGFSSPETGASFLCTLLPGGTTTPCSTGVIYGPLPDGPYGFTVRVKDAAGNLSTTTSMAFTINTAVPDTTAPSLLASTPRGGATGVTQRGNITATFREPVVGVTSRSFTLRTASGAGVAATVAYNVVTRVATLHPTVVLSADRRYIATLTGAVRDRAGNAMMPTSWSFVTGPRPAVAGRTPAPNATGVARTANVTARFTENVTAVNGLSVTLKNARTGAAVAAVVSYNSASRVMTLHPRSTLAAGTRFTVNLNGRIRDAAGNPLVPASWVFTTRRR